MTPSKLVRSPSITALALLVAALGVGVPVGGHSHHEGDERHVGPPSHAHGMGLVQHEMRLERSAAPVFVAPEARVVFLAPPPPVRLEGVPVLEECPCESRAPPTARPRAPPL